MRFTISHNQQGMVNMLNVSTDFLAIKITDTQVIVQGSTASGEETITVETGNYTKALVISSRRAQLARDKHV